MTTSLTRVIRAVRKNDDKSNSHSSHFRKWRWVWLESYESFKKWRWVWLELYESFGKITMSLIRVIRVIWKMTTCLYRVIRVIPEITTSLTRVIRVNSENDDESFVLVHASMPSCDIGTMYNFAPFGNGVLGWLSEVFFPWLTYLSF